MKDKLRILVTGGAGYIGSQTCKSLYLAGYEPVTLDNLSSGHRWAVKWGPLVQGDISNTALMVDILKKFKIKAVIHFAGYAYVGESLRNPLKYFQNNVTGTLNLLHAMIKADVKHIVFSSSCTVYGIPERIPIYENFPLKPINPYGESKVFIEKVLEWYGNAYGFNWIVLRYFNASGADPNGELGEVHDPETHLLPIVIKVAIGQRDYMEVFGSDYSTADGTAIRDYIHVTDLAEAHVIALSRLYEGLDSCILNLGTGRGYSVLEVIKTVERITNHHVTFKIVGRRKGDPPELVSEVSLSEKILGWKPKYIKLHDIIKTAWQWHLKC